jgi:hypothetical protein
MIDNNTDRMSVNSSIYLDRIVKVGGQPEFENPELRLQPDQPVLSDLSRRISKASHRGQEPGSVVVRERPGFSKSISQRTGNEVSLISYRKSDETRLIRVHN